MSIDESKKSKIQSELDNGVSKVGIEERRLAKGARKTDEGRLKHAESEEKRKKEEALIKATLKDKSEVPADEDEGWDSVEEDYPHIKIDELKDLQTQLAGMKIEGGDDEDEDEFEDEEEEALAKGKGKKKEETKKKK